MPLTLLFSLLLFLCSTLLSEQLKYICIYIHLSFVYIYIYIYSVRASPPFRSSTILLSRSLWTMNYAQSSTNNKQQQQHIIPSYRHTITQHTSSDFHAKFNLSRPIVECQSFQYQCGDGSCISGYKRCNGITDCADSADEYNCLINYDTNYGTAKE